MQGTDDRRAQPDATNAPAEPPKAAEVPAVASAAVAAASQTGEPAPTLPSATVELPSPLPPLTGREILALAFALALHAAMLLTTLAPDNRIGAAGLEPDAIGVDLVVLAAALDGRTSGEREGSPGIANGTTGTMEPAQAATPQDAAADLRKAAEPEEQQTAPESQSSTTVAPGLVIQPSAIDGSAADPLPADLAGDSTSAATMPPLRSTTAAPFMSPLDSAAATASDLASASQVQSDAGDSVDVTTAALALARAGRRDRYGAEVYGALRNSLPRYVPGQSGKVTVEFTILPAGGLTGLRVAISSGKTVLDEAALAAVRSARFPSPPPELAASNLTYSMEYSFADERPSRPKAVPQQR